MASLPLLLYFLIRRNRGNISDRKFILGVVVSAVIASGTGINPAYFFTLVIGILIYMLIVTLVNFGDFNNLKKYWKNTSVLFLILILLNLFWIIPTVNALFLSGKVVSSLSDIGFTNWVDSLSANSSLVNVMRLQGAWDWYSFDSATHSPLYLPYVVNYLQKAVFIAFSFVLPGISILALIFRKAEKNIQWKYLLFGVYLIIGVFLGAGSHEPTGEIFKFFGTKIPFFSFFRSPWYIFTPFTVLAYASLAALLFDYCWSRYKESKIVLFKNGSRLIILATFIIIAGQFLYSYPLITGKIFRPSRSNGFYINFPGYVWETKDSLSNDSVFPRLVIYPDDNIEAYDWGYTGVEPIINLFSNKEYIAPSLNADNAALSNYLNEFYSLMKKGNYSTALERLSLFGADTIFYKADQPTLASKVSTDMDKFADKKTIGNWFFYKNKIPEQVKKIYATRNLYVNMSSDKALFYNWDETIGKAVTINSIDSQLGFLSQESTPFYLGQAENIAQNDQTSDTQTFLFKIPQDGDYVFLLEKQGLYSLKDIEFQIDSKAIDPSFVDETDSFYKINPIHVASGEHKIQIKIPAPVNLIKKFNFTEENIYAKERLSTEELPIDLSNILVAFSDMNKEKVVDIPLDNFDPFSSYLLKYKYKYIYGSVPIIEILQGNKRTPLRTLTGYVGASQDWEQKEVGVSPVPAADSSLKILVTMPGNNKATKSKTYFEDFSLTRVFDNRLFFKEVSNKTIQSPPNIKYEKISPVKYKVSVDGAKEGYYLVLQERYNPGWIISSDNLAISPVHFTANGYMNAWYIPAGAFHQELTIYYKPQRYYEFGLLVSFVVLVLGLLQAFVNKRK